MKLNLASLFLTYSAFAVAEEAAPTIVDLAVATEDLSTLVAAVQAAELVDTLADPDGTFTVFAPTNEAFEGIDEKFLTEPWKTHLTDILSFHVLGDTVLAADVSDGAVITALSGENFTATVNDTGVFFGTDLFSSQVTTADVEASNGVVHIVNAFFVPNWVSLTLADIAANVEGFDSVARFITQGGLEDEISAENRTIFAPNADAFATVPADLTGQIANDESLIAVILKHHIVEGVWSAASLSDGLELTTLDGNTLTVTITDEGAMIESSMIVETDYLAINGVSHVISTVLLPPDLMPGGGGDDVDAPTATPVDEPTSNAMALGSAGSLLATVMAALL